MGQFQTKKKEDFPEKAAILYPGAQINDTGEIPMIDRYLEDLENRIDPETEEMLEAEWRQFLAGDCPDQIFHPKRKQAAPPKIEWPKILINTALKDKELMLLRELCGVSAALAAGNGTILNIRCNYSTTILPSLFGVEIFYLEDQHDTLPASRPLPDGADGIRRLLDAGIPGFDRGWGPDVFQTAFYICEKLNGYPKIREYVRLYHPDLQGPLDITEMIWGSDIFMEFYDNPDLVKSFLTLATETYRGFMNRWNELVPPLNTRFSTHWGWGHAGKIVLRDDSAMNLSPEMYEEFALPFDRQLLQEFGGGVVHFCGKGDHYIDRLAAVPGLTGIQLSQPEYNDMERIFQYTVDRGIPLLDLPYESGVKPALETGRSLHGQVYLK